MDLQIGSTVGDYQVIGILGAGGMGKVYKVRNTISDRVEALKVLLPDLANAPELADRFLREIKVQASLEHPNIAALHTALRVENQLLMLMEFVEGVTLEQLLKEHGRLPVANAVNYIAQVLSALEYAHAHGVIHRDIKPANMMLTPAGAVKLMDFGIAKGAGDHKLTMTGTTLGSLYYMSPEQIQGAVNLDARSDLYSVGVSLYELVTGKRPFDGDSQFAIMSAHLKNTPVPPIAIDPTLPQALNDVILLSVAKDANARFQGAAAFRNALGSLMGGMGPAAAARPASVAAAVAAAPSAMPTEVVPPTPHMIQPAAPQRPRSRRGLWMALGGIATAAVVIGAIEFGPWKGTKAAPQAPAAQSAPAAQTPASSPPLAQPEPVAPAVPTSAPAATAVPQLLSPPPVRQAKQAPAPRSSAQPAAAQPPPQEQPAAQPAQPPPQPVAQPPQPPPGPSAAEVEKARDRYDMLEARSTTILNHSLFRSQAASGMNIRSDAANARTLMQTYLRNAADALNSGNLTSAANYMEKAERQIEILEKILN
jgi:eukaryotic-like serine/threonine-protein kinase